MLARVAAACACVLARTIERAVNHCGPCGAVECSVLIIVYQWITKTKPNQIESSSSPGNPTQPHRHSDRCCSLPDPFLPQDILNSIRRWELQRHRVVFEDSQCRFKCETMNQEALSFTLTQINHLVSSLNKKNFEQNSRQIEAVNFHFHFSFFHSNDYFAFWAGGFVVFSPSWWNKLEIGSQNQQQNYGSCSVVEWAMCSSVMSIAF